MASAVDPTSPKSGKVVRSLSSSWSNVPLGEVEPNSGAAAPITFTTPPSSPSAFRKASPEPLGRLPRKASSGSGSPLSSVGSDHGVISNAADAASTPTGRKTAWNFQPNGAFEAVSIIDTVSWPALSELAKNSPKSASSDSLNPLPDTSVSDPPVRWLASCLKFSQNFHKILKINWEVRDRRLYFSTCWLFCFVPGVHSIISFLEANFE